MRGDVQYDGFEYNWFFRTDKWRSEVGKLSTGAWVRRRRWVRLMMKPAIHPSKAVMAGAHTSLHHFALSSRPSSVSDSDSESLQRSGFVWEGDPQADWIHCHDCLRSFPRDGKKLEIWRQWLGLRDQDDAEVIRKQWTEDEAPLPSQTYEADRSTQDWAPPVPTDVIVPVIRENIKEILKTFVFPDSRAQFFVMLRNAGISTDVFEAGVVIPLDSTQSLNFWSYAHEQEKHTQDKGKGKPI